MAREADDVKLIGVAFSPFVFRAKVALNIKGVKFENLEETVGKKSDILVQSSPIYKKMPVLLHAGKPICESLVILQYIDEAWAADRQAILPSDPYERAIARFWAAYTDDKIFSHILEILKVETEEEKLALAKQVIAAVVLLEEAFEKCSQGRAFFNGDRIGYVDIALGCFLRWFEVVQIFSGKQILTKEETPLLHGWAERFCDHDAVRNDLPATEQFVEFAKILQSFWGISSAPK